MKRHRDSRPNRQHALGKSPGSTHYIGLKSQGKFSGNFHQYAKDKYRSGNFQELNEIEKLPLDASDQFWIDFRGIQWLDNLDVLTQKFRLHPLIIEDILNTDHRVKIDMTDHYVFVILKMLFINPKTNAIITEPYALYIDRNYLLSFHETNQEEFLELVRRLELPESRLRQSGLDYLVIRIIDTIVDQYYVVLDHIIQQIESLEDLLFQNIDSESIPEQIQHLKRDILYLRRHIAPLRDIIAKLEKPEISFVSDQAKPYYKDVYDHVVQINESIEIYREMIWGLMDLHMTGVSHKMNNIMKVLTIISTIFIPLTFIVGIYGMNFKYIPELSFKNGYYGVLVVMGLLVMGMVLYFKKKKWL
jgi:magnesium transporter